MSTFGEFDFPDELARVFGPSVFWNPNSGSTTRAAKLGRMRVRRSMQGHAVELAGGGSPIIPPTGIVPTAYWMRGEAMVQSNVETPGRSKVVHAIGNATGKRIIKDVVNLPTLVGKQYRFTWEQLVPTSVFSGFAVRAEQNGVVGDAYLVVASKLWLIGFTLDPFPT